MEAQVIEARSVGARAILGAAEQLFCAHGYDAVSVQDIAAKAGSSRANIFHHFGSKEGLYLAVIREACQRAGPLREALLDGRQPFSRRLQDFAFSHLSFLLEHAGAARLVLRELLKGDDRRGRELVDKHVMGENLTRWIALLVEAQQRGEIDKRIDAAVAAVLLVGANVFFFQTRELLRHVPGIHFADDPKYFSEQLAQTLFNGLDARRPHGGRTTGKKNVSKR